MHQNLSLWCVKFLSFTQNIPVFMTDCARPSKNENFQMFMTAMVHTVTKEVIIFTITNQNKKFLLRLLIN